jgi:prepilin-type N-terminal cleavage/methylation domain-containing protein
MMRNRKGFTILEVLITILIMSVALWALSALQTSAISTNYTSHRLTIATMLAQDKLEELKSLAWNDSQLADLDLPPNTNFTKDTDADGTADDFDWTLARDHTNADGPAGQANPIDQNGNFMGVGNTLGYTREWNVVNGMPFPNTKTISVRVQWSQKSNYEVIIDTVMSEG